MSDVFDRDLVVRAATAGDGAALGALFARAEIPCNCRYWHFEGDKNAWLERTYVDVGANRAEMEAAMQRGAGDARGVVAIDGGDGDDRIVGWLKVAPAESVAKAYDQKLYRNLPVFAGERRGVHLLACAVVDPAQRHRGVYRALVRGAIVLAPRWGATALEALPRRSVEPLHDAELWVGHARTLLDAGFVEAHAFAPYPVLRLTLPTSDRS